MKHVVRLLFVCTLVLVAASEPARADTRIGLSRDGVTWSSSLDEPLFDPDDRWVPGDTRSARFYVRNQAGQPAQLSVEVVGTQVDSLIETGDLTVAARGGDGRWHDVSSPGRHQLVSAVDVDARDRTPVDVSVSLAADSGNQSQLKLLRLDFRAVLSETAGSAAGQLPPTGAPTLWAVIIGLTLVLGGTVLASRRREEEGPHAQS